MQTKAQDRRSARPPSRAAARAVASDAAPSTSSPTTTSHTARPAMCRVLTSKPPPASARPTIRAIGAISAAVWSNLARDARDAPPPGPNLGPLARLAPVSVCSAGIRLLSGSCSGRTRVGSSTKTPFRRPPGTRARHHEPPGTLFQGQRRRLDADRLRHNVGSGPERGLRMAIHLRRRATASTGPMAARVRVAQTMARPARRRPPVQPGGPARQPGARRATAAAPPRWCRS